MKYLPSQKVFFSINFLWVALFSSSLLAQPQDIKHLCSDIDDTSTILLVPIIFSYKDFSLRREDIYNSLHSKLERSKYVKWRDQSPVETKFDIESGRFAIHFCLRNWKNLERRVMLKLKIGLKRLEIPIRSTELPIKIYPNLKVMSHPPIVLLDQPAPDWMIPIRGSVSRIPKGGNVIDFQIYNPSTKGLIGPKIVFIASRRSHSYCASAGPTHISNVDFSLDSGSISSGEFDIVSTEPAYDGQIIRTARIEKNECSFGTRVTMPLGEIPTIKPDEIVRFIYKASGVKLLQELVLFPGQPRYALKFTGGRIFPDTINLK